MNRSELVSELNHRLQELDRSDVNNHILRYRNVILFVNDNAIEIAKEMVSMFQDLAVLKLKSNNLEPNSIAGFVDNDGVKKVY